MSQTDEEKKAAEEAAAAKAAEDAKAAADANALAVKEAKGAAAAAKTKAKADKKVAAIAPAAATTEKVVEGERRLLLRRTDPAGWVSYLSDFGGSPGWNDDVEKARIITTVDDAHALLKTYGGDGSDFKIVKAPS